MDKNTIFLDKDGVLHVTLVNNFLAEARDLIDQATQNLRPKQVNLDLSLLDCLDTLALSVIIGRYNILKEAKIPMFIVNPTQKADKILTQSGLYNIIPKIVM